MSAVESAEHRVWAVLEQVPDPEIPVLSVVDLGIARAVRVDEQGVEVTITPTYSGCPAMHAIEQEIRSALAGAGLAPVRVRTVLDPAWSTDWMSESGKRKLAEYGIAPPGPASCAGTAPLQWRVRCPRCGSLATRLLSEFGSTACKALYQCRECLEPFDYFKPL
ncbi:MAG TPA: 1,2-phenylacetyl-CoA epoxidase subunit PaaD [Candidatus Competibacteraceae bacterium]|nr:1,2-phenylacetyl-CoA epoxidase subunit PaaD [Candidatus Competibacteraceae bacterium]